MRRGGGLPKLPPPGRITLSGFVGVNDLIDPTETPDGFLVAAENLRFDRGVPRLRTGYVQEAAVSGMSGAPTGFGLWRMPSVAGTSSKTAVKRNRVVAGVGSHPEADGFSGLHLWVDQDDGNGFVDQTPCTGAQGSTTGSLLSGTYRPTYFAQFKGKLYGVNGVDGLFFWDGFTGQSNVAVDVAQPPKQSILPCRNEIEFLGFGSAYPVMVNPAIQGTVTDAPQPLDPPLPVLGSYAEAIGDQVVVQSGIRMTNFLVGFSCYLDFTQVFNQVGGSLGVLDWTQPAMASPVLTLVFGGAENQANVFQVTIGTGDPTGAFTDTNSYSWPVSIAAAPYSEAVNLDLSDVPASILSAVRFIAFSALVNYNDQSPVQQVFIDQVYLPGYLDAGTNRYVAKAVNSTTGISSTRSAVAEVDCYLVPDGALPSVPQGGQAGQATKPVTARAQITVDWSTIDPAADSVRVYRAITPVLSDPTQDTYFQLVELRRADAVNGKSVYYDITPTAALAQGPELLWDTHPPGKGPDAPRLVLSTATRLQYAGSDRNSNRVWAADIGEVSSAPDVPFNEAPNVGQGGYADAGHDDGDFIVAMVSRVNETILLKQKALWVWSIRGEGTDAETWIISRLTTPGCVAPRSVAQVPNGLVWAYDDGMYYLSDFTDIAEPLPMTSQVQTTWDAIPEDQKANVACAYHTRDRILYVAVAGPGSTTNDVVMKYDFRTRQWIGVDTPSGSTPFAYGILACDRIDATQTNLYFIRQDSAAIDRLKIAGVDTLPYYERASEAGVAFRLETRWHRPIPGHRIRLVRRRLTLLYAPFTTAQQYKGGAEVFNVSATAQLVCRPPWVSSSQSYTYVAPDGAASNDGEVMFGDPSETEVDPSMEGEQFKLILTGGATLVTPPNVNTATNVELRIGPIEVDFIDQGVWNNG